MNRISLYALAASLAVAPLAARADTVLNLNATTGNASTSYGGGYNNLAPSFYQTVTLGPGTYTISAVGAGYTASDGTSAVYTAFSYDSANPGPGANSFREYTGYSMGGTFSNASASNGYQNSYTLGAVNGTFFGQGTYATAAAALAAASPITFTLASATTVTFFADDSSYLPSDNAFGYDDNSGGVSLDIKAVTPEPSSLMLLGTGVLSLAGAVRRRFKA